jgi:hypothetical protein
VHYSGIGDTYFLFKAFTDTPKYSYLANKAVFISECGNES